MSAVGTARAAVERSVIVALVDSDGWNLRSTMRALRELDCRVIGFASVELAFAQIAAQRVDVVIDAQGSCAVGGRTLGGALRASLGGRCPTLVLIERAETSADTRSDYDLVLASPVRALDLVAALDRARTM